MAFYRTNGRYNTKIIAITSSSGVSFAIHIIQIIIVVDFQVIQLKSTKYQLCENSMYVKYRKFNPSSVTSVCRILL